jgi:GxxExxY protein
MKTYPSLPHGELTGDVITAFLEAYHELGSGFSEKVCLGALAVVLTDRKLRVFTNAELTVLFRGRRIGHFFADMVVNETVLIEIKANQSLEGYAQAQLLNYLKAAGGGVGLLLNFGRRPEYKRMVVGNPLNSLPVLRQSLGITRKSGHLL